ncbi:MAG: sugar ABC transporter permease [Paenibacillaceae bacterium]|nr:sugar ABC transporter permease [Paenibacillaceae bacterium]
MHDRFRLRRIFSRPQIAVFLIATPGLLHFLLFKYYPLLGNVIAFQDYDLFRGIWRSDWVGLDHFVQMFQYGEFVKILRNTLLIGVYQLVFGFPAPLLLALLMNEIRMIWFKRVTQSVLYLPHFLSWIIVGSMFVELLAPEGPFNALLVRLFGINPVYFMTEPLYFRGILVSVGIWKGIGWGTIIYLAAMAGINPNLYEAAVMDGANRRRQMTAITIPALMPAIVVLFLLNVGHLLDKNVEQMLVFLNPLVRDVGEVIDTYVYRVGLIGAQYSYTTAIGIFKSVVGLALVVSLNQLSKRMTGETIY